MFGKREYQRLPGRRGRTFSHILYSLWLGNDHLLQVSNSYFTEDYQRFYYRDIEAIIVCKTDRATVSNAIFLAIAGVAIIGALFSDTVGRTAWGIVAGLFFILFIFNFVRGPTCLCFLRTAVQLEQLRSLDRLRSARRAIARLQPLIETAQAQFAQLEPTAAATAEATTPRPASPPPANSAVSVAPPKRHEPGRFHSAVFGLLLVAGPLSYASIFYHHVFTTLALIASLLALGACTLVALVKQHESDIGTEVGRTLWATLGYLCAMAVLGYIYWLALYIRDLEHLERPEQVYNYWEWLQRFAAQSPLDSPFLFSIYIFSIIGSVSLGSLGLFWFIRHWRRPPSAPPPIPASL